MDEASRAHGSTTTSMATGYISGAMVACTMVSMLIIKNKASEYTAGQMEGATRANGTRAASMVTVSTFRAPPSTRALGKTEKGYTPTTKKTFDYYLVL